MPMPWTYRHAEAEWRGILDDLREILGTPSDNVAYTGLEGVLATFRARLTVEQALTFAQVLPALPRALFVQGWQIAAPVPWADRATYISEAQALRADHNFTSEKVVEAASYALQRAICPADWARALGAIGPEAHAFWRIEGYAPEDLAPRFR